MIIGFIVSLSLSLALTLSLALIIRYKINEIREMNIINMVLSKLDYCPNHYKIIRKDNKIFIKCHYYTKTYSHLIFNGYIINIIKQDANRNYYITTYTREQASSIYLNNYDKNKELGIIAYDILIDMKNKNYKIITSYFQIINCIKDDENLYTKMINCLEDKTFYIIINYIYDENLNIYNSTLNSYNELFYKEFGKKEQLYRFNYIEKFNITITNDKDRIVITPILIQTRKQPTILTQISSLIDTKPHINNNIAIKTISGIFI